jgi:hypothetical protein
MKHIFTNINYVIDENRQLKEYMRNYRIYSVGDSGIVEDVTRAGIVFYTTIGGKLYYLLGIDSKSGNYSDFGGRVERHERGNFYETAVRELHEETTGLFRSTYPDITHFYDSILIVEAKTAIIFKKIDMSLDRIVKYIVEYARMNVREREMRSLTLIEANKGNMDNIYRRISLHFNVFNSIFLSASTLEA